MSGRDQRRGADEAQRNPGVAEVLPESGVSPASGLRLRVQHGFPGFRLDVDLSLPGKGITVLFGHSGSGKTTLLRCVAGLERARESHIALNGECWQKGRDFAPTWRRAIGYVFQEASLFPHLDVRGNLAFGMKRATGRVNEDEIRVMADRFGIAHLLARKPEGLSGGERQRVAIARALLTRPQLLLMDEPLSALDNARKQEILPYLERLHDELEIPVLYVTHQVEEAARLADHIVLMEQGRVLATGPAAEVLTRLDLQGSFSDEMGSVLDARVVERDEHYSLSRIAFAGGSLLVGGATRAIGSKVRARVLARDVSLATVQPGPSSILNAVPATVLEIRDDGVDKVNVRLAIGEAGSAEGAMLVSRITRRSRDLLALEVGQAVHAQVKSVALLT
ncbi:molybdenum ABC transporter ATP-binding protein [Viridibacterium curvum]|uniref:Molybdenum ABC transporter ATP-binding protein n=1 Tax=Viridibacterium curvum TaxID=1101404 RepID=A0ABP9R5T3_9RHOO